MFNDDLVLESMRVKIQCNVELLRSTTTSEVACSLSDIIPDIETRIMACITYLERNNSKLSKHAVQCVSSFLINQFVQNEKGIFLSKSCLQRILCELPYSRPLCWIKAQKILLDFGTCINFSYGTLDHLSFSDCCVYSLMKVHESAAVDSNHFLRRVLCYSLCLVNPNWISRLGEHWFTNLFELAKTIALDVCQNYGSCSFTECSLSVLFSVSPFAIAGTALGISLRNIAGSILEETHGSAVCISTILYNAYVDCLSFFCNSNFSEEKRVSLFLCCLKIYTKEAERLEAPTGEFFQEKSKFKLADESGNQCFFVSNILLSKEHNSFWSKLKVSFKESHTSCFDNSLYFRNFVDILSRKQECFSEKGVLGTTKNWESILEETDDELKVMYFNDEQYISQKIRLLSQLGYKL